MWKRCFGSIVMNEDIKWKRRLFPFLFFLLCIRRYFNWFHICNIYFISFALHFSSVAYIVPDWHSMYVSHSPDISWIRYRKGKRSVDAQVHMNIKVRLNESVWKKNLVVMLILLYKFHASIAFWKIRIGMN